MNSIFKNHYEKMLVALGAIFLLAIIFVFVWSVSFLSDIFSGTFNPDNSNNQAIRFNTEEAKNLNLNIGN